MNCLKNKKLYRKIPIIGLGFIFVQKAFLVILVGLFSGELIFERGLSLEGILRFKMDGSS